MKYSSCSSFRNLRAAEKNIFVKKYITIIIEVIHARYSRANVYGRCVDSSLQQLSDIYPKYFSSQKYCLQESKLIIVYGNY